MLDGGMPIDIVDWVGRTALQWAAMFKQTDVIHKLLQRGADVNKRDRNDGRTALHYSARKNNNYAIWLLLQNGALTTIKDNEGRTPIDYALEVNSQEAVLLLQQ